MPTGDAYSSGHLVLSLCGLALHLLVETSDTLYRLDIIPVCDIITELDILTDIGFHRASVTGVAYHRGRLLLRTPGPVPFGLAYVLLFETNPFPNLSLLYRTMLFEYPSVLSRFCFTLPSSTTVTSQPIRLSTNFMTLIPTLTFTELRVVSIEHLQRGWHASRERLPFRTPGSVPQFWTC